MKDSSNHDGPLARVEHEAAAWVLRCDRGLTPAEQDAFSEWLAADPSHGTQLARHRRHWGRLDGLAQWQPEHSGLPNPDLLAPPSRRLLRFLPVTATLAAAAAVAAFLFHSRSVDPAVTTRGSQSVATVPPATVSGARVLEDGTIVELNGDSAITVEFTAAERRVRLERGEAHFAVTTNPARPFIVNAAGIDVRAVGTAFNVRVNTAAVEVLVTEGKVRLDSRATEATRAPGPREPDSPAAPLVPVLETRQRAVVSLGATPPPPQIDTLTAGEIERVLAWHHRLLNFTEAPLQEIVAEFNRRNAVQLVILDPELATIRISASFRSDNVEGFVALFETGFGARAERRGDSEIVLRKVRD